jgi:hypothetical protein
MNTVARTVNSILQGGEMDERLIKMAITTLIRVSIITSYFGLVGILTGVLVFVIQRS